MNKIEIFLKQNRIPFKKYESLSQYTTLKIGGVAEFVLFPDEDTVLKVIEIIKNEQIPCYVIGGGSNLLAPDEGFKGVIINTKNINRISSDGFNIRSSAGVMLQRLIGFMLRKKLSGLEGLVGIPGTVGGAIKGNAGSFGYEISDCLVEIEVITDKLETQILKKKHISFQYRSSDLDEKWFIKSATFSLKEDDGESLRRIKEFFKRKRQTQPLTECSAGCVFKNPEGQSAGYLIEKAGLKGFRVGDIIVSNTHANYFINIGKGRASDFLKLMEIVKETVFKLFSIELIPEIKILEA